METRSVAEESPTAQGSMHLMCMKTLRHSDPLQFGSIRTISTWRKSTNSPFGAGTSSQDSRVFYCEAQSSDWSHSTHLSIDSAFLWSAVDRAESVVSSRCVEKSNFSKSKRGQESHFCGTPSHRIGNLFQIWHVQMYTFETDKMVVIVGGERGEPEWYWKTSSFLSTIPGFLRSMMFFTRSHDTLPVCPLPLVIAYR